jgi:multidrug efflux pump subunit AcrA (membrane-fusion protein)
LAGSALGAALLISGVAWSTLAGGRAVYSVEQADEYEAAATALHAATSGHAAAGSPPVAAASAAAREAAVAAARERFDRARSTLDSARFAQNELGKWLMGIGLAAVIAFGVGYLTSQGESD